MSYYYVSAKLLPYLPHKYKHLTTDQSYILHRKDLITYLITNYQFLSHIMLIALLPCNN